VESKLGPLGTSATEWPIVPASVIMMMENFVEWRLARETEVLGENLYQRHFIHHKSYLTRLELEPGPPRWLVSSCWWENFSTLAGNKKAIKICTREHFYITALKVHNLDGAIVMYYIIARIFILNWIFLCSLKKKLKLSPYQAVKAHRGVRGRGSHIF
jgi:hypothetical protein